MDKPAPASMAISTRGSLIWKTTVSSISVQVGSIGKMREVRMLNALPSDISYRPKVREANKAIIGNATRATIRAILTPFFSTALFIVLC